MSDRAITSDPIVTSRASRRINIVLRQQETPISAESEQKEASLPSTYGPFTDMSKELDQLVGLESVKELVFEVYALLQINRYRTEAGLISGAQVYHMLFKGNPGTGKTTLARIIAKLFQSMGFLQKGHLIEAERADLVGEYIGHTALKTRELVKKSLGGVLFIDEAYSLARGGEKDFGKEAIDTLVKAMEDYKNQFVLILAGYTTEMEQFMLMNPGLPSRFPIQIDFPDYSVDQLIQIAELMAKERQYTFMPQTVMQMRQHIAMEKEHGFHSFSNARYVRNLLEQTIRQQAVRLMKQYPKIPGKQELMMLMPEDIKTIRS